MVTDGILTAVNLIGRKLPTIKESRIADMIWEMLSDFDEDEWAAMSHEESCQWLDRYITQYKLAKEDN